ERLGGGLPHERLAWSGVECGCHALEVVPRVAAEVGALGEVLAQQAVGVLVGAALPRTARVAEEDLQAGREAEFGVPGHLGALIPGQRSTQLLGQRRDRRSDRVADGFGAVSCERWAVLDAHLTMAGHAWQVEEDREPGGAFNQRADRRAVQAEDEIAFPMTGNRSIRDLRRPLADHDLGGDEVLAAAGANSRNAKGAAGAQTRGQVPSQRPTALDIQRLVDRLVRDPNRSII